MRTWALATTLLTIAACKPADETSETPEAAGAAPTEAPAESQPQPEADPGERVVARVDGRPLTVADVDRHLKMTPPGTPRQDVTLALIDRMVFESEAARQNLRVHENEVAAATDGVAQSNGLTIEALKKAVLEQTGMSWADYEEEIRAQILEVKVLQMLGVDMASQSATEQQRRVMLCLRARSETEVLDEKVKLPANPYDLDLKVTGLTVQGEPGLDSKTLEAAVLAGVEPGPACEVLLGVEPVLLNAYLDAGYVRAEVDVQWPLQPDPQVVLTVMAQAGDLHRIGTITFDQSQVGADERIDEARLREVVGTELKAGDVASMAKMKAGRDRLNALLKVMSLPEALAETNFDDGQTGVVDLIFVIPGG